MDEILRTLVRQRAQYRCEYCLLPQALQPLKSFHIEHIVPRQHDGQTTEANLALSCPQCNQRKGPNLTGVDPTTNSVTQLFNPRVHRWDEHFAQVGNRIIGKTPIGRVTVQVLAMNSSSRLQLRGLLGIS